MNARAQPVGPAGVDSRRRIAGNTRRPILACLRWLGLVACVALAARARAEEPAVAAWHPVTWNGEKAMAADSGGMTAIVSLERGRLVHFGSLVQKRNLLFAPATRDDPAGWGGHRLWLGPQRKWAAYWPPPAAWEHAGAESFTIELGQLRLAIPDAGEGWPRLVRTYVWSGDVLICGAELTGGKRPAQIIQIVQIPMSGVVLASASPSTFAPRGYVRLPTAVRELTTDFEPPPQVHGRGRLLELHHTGVAEKLGFVPQILLGREEGAMLHVGRGEPGGRFESEPDQGFFSQVFLGSHEPFIELEQLSPQFAAGESARFEITLKAALVDDR